MTHSFETEIAQLVGVEAAILYQNIKFWCDKNKANMKHLYHGKFWTYNSKNAFLELFPYMTYNQIKTALKKLKDTGLIDVKSGLGDDKWDKSNWYAIIDHSIGEKTPMDWSENANDARVSTNTDNKPDSSIVISQAQSLIDKWNTFAAKHGLSVVLKLTEKRKKKIIARFKDTKEFDRVFDGMLLKVANSSFLLGSNGWKVDFDFLIDSEQNYIKVYEGKYDDDARY